MADEAGISVGSLYQYFPNKQALVAALHDDDLEQGWETANQILDNPRWSARRRLVEVTRWFFDSEAEEAHTLGAAAGDIHVFLNDQTARTRNAELMIAPTHRAAEFIESSSTARRTRNELHFAADHLVSTIEALAKPIATRDCTPAQRRKWADRTANMLADQLDFPA